MKKYFYTYRIEGLLIHQKLNGMKKLYLPAVLAFLLAGGSYTSVYAQKDQVRRVEVDDETGTPTFIEFEVGQLLSQRQSMPELFRSVLSMRQGEEMRLVQVNPDGEGFVHQKYQLYYQGIKVEHAEYYAHIKGAYIQLLNGHYEPVEGVSTKARLSEKQALDNALRQLQARRMMWNLDPEVPAPKGELVIVKTDPALAGKKAYTLAYKFDIYTAEPLARDYVYVDAQSGQIVRKDPIIKHAVATGTAATRYSGSRSITTDSYNGSFRLRDYSRGNGILTYDLNQSTNYNSAVDFVDNDNNWTAAEWNNAAKDNAALDAHWGAQMTYDYWKNVHGRNSFDGNGAAIKSYVHYSSNYDNAFWDGQRMTYGDGSGTYFDALTSLDVAAHEIGHAVTTYTANLTYSYESGALNEGYSDIWAACVEYHAAPEKSIWLIGEDIERRSGHVALRSMSNPKQEGQPDTYKGTNWYSGSGDNGGVHTNSGVLNHWFYILSVGKSGTNDIGNSYNVTGIGIEKAEKIAFRAISVYLTSSSKYADARTATIQAAKDLYGAGSNEEIQTTNAWYAVGVGSAYNGGGGGTSYCNSQGNNSSYEWIAQVNVGSFTNSSGAAGYTDFTSKTITLAPGASVNVSLTPGFSSSSYTEYWRIWIDYNGNGSFDDSGELVYSSGGSKTTVSGSFTVPTSASGTTRMRISMKYNEQPTSCETFSYGEVEDYTVEFSGSAPAPCNTPAGLSASNITSSSATLSWGAVSGAAGYDVRYKATSSSTWTTTSTTSTSLSVSGLSASTQYEFQVRTQCSGSTSNYSSSYTFATSGSTPPPSSYCSANGNNDYYFWIDYVGLNNMTNTTGKDGGYGDYTSKTATITKGATERLYISAGYRSTRYTVYWRIWIDFDGNGSFDADEVIVEGSSSSASQLYGDFTVPTSAITGTTRMRVSMKYGSYASSCGSFSYGEVEDYTVSIGNAFGIGAQEVALRSGSLQGDVQFVALYPNPATYTAQLVPGSVENGSLVRVLDLRGAEVLRQVATGNNCTLDVRQLQAGIYIVEVQNELGVSQYKLVKQ